MFPYRFFILAAFTILFIIKSPAMPDAASPLTFEIIREFPHDSQAFTQGLVFAQGSLYEGTGLRGQSSLRRVDLQTGQVLQQHSLAPALFGEGVTVFQDKIYQLTYTSQRAFVYDQDSFAVLQEFQYATSQLAQTTLRSILGQFELDELLSEREKINEKHFLFIFKLPFSHSHFFFIKRRF